MHVNAYLRKFAFLGVQRLSRTVVTSSSGKRERKKKDEKIDVSATDLHIMLARVIAMSGAHSANNIHLR